MGRTKVNVGLFTGYILDPFCELIHRGAIRAAEEMDVNLIIFPGNYLDLNRESDQGFYYEYQPNTLFSYADKGGIDVLLACVSTIGCLSTPERRRWLIDSVKDIPVLTVASEEEGYSYVIYDNKSGLRDAIKYLIETKKVRKIGMISGPLDNYDFAERYHTYCETLSEYQIPVEDNRVVYGDATALCTDIVEDLLDRNPDLEAIVAANDSMAFAVYEVCEKRGINIGRDLYVTGFDDTEEACKLSPPLSSVRADADLLGYQSVKLALQLLKGKDKVSDTVPTKFVPRESVGYQAEDLRKIIYKIFNGKTTDETRAKITTGILNYVFYAQTSSFRTEKYFINIKSILDLLAGSAYSDCNKTETIVQIYNCFLKLIDDGFSDKADQHRILQLYTIGLQELPLCNKCETYKYVLNKTLTEQIKYLMDCMIFRSDAKCNRYEGILRTTNRISRDMLMNDSLGEQSYQAILSKMSKMNIQHSYLYLYETPQLHRFQEKWNRPEYILLKAYQDNNNLYSVPRTKQKMRSSEVFNNKYFDSDERHTWVALDLYSCEWQYGIFVCDLKYKNFNLAELLMNQISPAVKMINLFLKEQSTQKELEETLEQLTLNNITLDRISKFDELTGILNRRGFMEQGKDLLSKAEGKDVLVAYADLDSLKVINDTFGHDEGDFALRAAMQILSIVFYQNGIIGRLGGDEFAALMICDAENTIQNIRDRVRQAMEDYNAGIDKPYRVQVSVGIDRITYANGMQLSDMLSQADDILYQEKKHKKNILIKNENKALKETEIEQLIHSFLDHSKDEGEDQNKPLS